MAEPWFKQIENNINRFKNLSIIHLNIDEDIEDLAKRGMVLQCNISDEELTLISNDKDVVVTHRKWN